MIKEPGLSLIAVCMQCKQHIVTNMMLTKGQPCIETKLLGKSECTQVTVSRSNSPDLAAKIGVVLIADSLVDHNPLANCC